MIRKLQKRFIRIAVLVLTAAMVLVVGIVNAANLIIVRNELQGTLAMLAESNLPLYPAALPDQNSSEENDSGKNDPGKTKGPGDSAAPGARFEDRNRHFRNMMNESNWFAVHFSPEGDIRSRNMFRTADMDEETAEILAGQALASGQASGWIQDYCFLVRNEGDFGYAVVILNCETRMAAVRNLALISALACAGGILLSWLLVTLFSRKAVEPTIRNMEQQKQFITNASHELKTPLTVISTNMELLKMENPDNPWIRSTQKQTGNMRHLVDELVYLSRMEEEHPVLNMESLPLASLLRETAEPFQAMAEFGGKEMSVRAEEHLRVTGDRPSLQRLMSTLLDNAVKYTPESGMIRAEAFQDGKSAVIRISNTVEKPMTKEQCTQLFNRFYRADESRNKEKQSGFGIGLAIASAIAEKHGGTMEARMEGEMLQISARLPRDHKPDTPAGTKPD